MDSVTTAISAFLLLFLCRAGIEVTLSNAADFSEQSTSSRGAPCGFTATASNTPQLLRSVGWPALYPNSATCEWTINSSPDHVIQLVFNSFATERCCDYLWIMRPDKSVMHELKGSNLNLEPITSESSMLLLRFYSDASVQRTGFELTYQEIKPIEVTSTPAPETTTEAPCEFVAIAKSTPQILSSPGWPNNYPNNIDCEWTITSLPGHAIRLTFNNFTTEYCCDYLEIMKPDRSVMYRLRGEDLIVEPITSENYSLIVNFHSDISVPQGGFELTYEEIETVRKTTAPAPTTTTRETCGFTTNATTTKQYLRSPGWPHAYSNNLDCEWRITNTPGHLIHLNFDSFSAENCCDYLQILSEDEGLIIEVRGNEPPSDAILSSTSSFVLRFHSDHSITEQGFALSYQDVTMVHAVNLPATAKANFKLAACGFNATATDMPQSIKSTGYPDAYPNSQDCVWRLTSSPGHVIRLHVNSFVTEHCCDTLKIGGGSKDEWFHELRGSEVQPQDIFSSTKTMTLWFHSDPTTRYSGFELTFQEVDRKLTTTALPIATTAAPCGFNATASSTPLPLRSVGWPNVYPNSQDCTWTLNSSPGHVIQLVINRFATERCCDYLQILSPDGSVLREFRGNNLNVQLFTSTSNKLILRFHSDESVQRGGFELSYRKIERSQITPEPTTVSTTTTSEDSTQGPCGFNAIASSTPQTLRSVGWPQLYPNSITCEWTINSSPGHVIQLVFNSFVTERCCDYLKVLRPNRRVIQDIRGYDLHLEPITSTENKVILKFYSDGSVQHSGFELTYQEILVTTTPPPTTTTTAPCGFTANASSTPQKLQSVGWPNMYPYSAICVWTINSSPGHVIRLVFNSFSTEHCCDFLQIRQGADENLVVDLRGKPLPSLTPITSTDNKVILRFFSDGSVRDSGFELTYQEIPAPITLPTTTTTTTTTTAAPCGFTATATSIPQPLRSVGWTDSYYHPYLKSQDCEWIINCSPGHVILLTIEVFMTEGCCDYLKVLRPDRSVMHDLRGYNMNIRTIISTSNQLILVFHSDESIEESGFVLTYQETEQDFNQVTTTPPQPTTQSSLCGSTLVATNTPQFLGSPGWPGRYLLNLQCRWVIVTIPNNIIELNFTFFETEPCCDYLLISSKNGSHIRYMVGVRVDISQPVYSPSNFMKLLFVTTSSFSHYGFKLTYKGVPSGQRNITSPETPATTHHQEQESDLCSSNLTASDAPQFIRSPGWPYVYPHSLQCEWTITSSPRNVIELTFNLFDTESCCDHLVITAENGSIIRDMHGNQENISHPIYSPSNNLKIVFRTDISVTKFGFEFTYREIRLTTTLSTTTLPTATSPPATITTTETVTDEANDRQPHQLGTSRRLGRHARRIVENP